MNLPILGSSAKITAMASTVRGNAKGGKTAMAFKPGGVKAAASGLSSGLAPPPGSPGEVLPGGTPSL